METDRNRLLNICGSLPSEFVDTVMSSAPWERSFIDEEAHPYSPFILWTVDEIESFQPTYDLDFMPYLAIGSNGGMETYLLHKTNGTIWVADLVAGTSSLEMVAESFCLLLHFLNAADRA